MPKAPTNTIVQLFLSFQVSLGCIPGTPRWFDLLQVPSKYGSKKNIEKFFWEHQVYLILI